MVQGRIHNGCVETEEPIPQSWEGQLVKIMPLTPDDPLPDLDGWLQAMKALGPMEIEPAERAAIVDALAELDRVSKVAMQDIAGRQP